MADRNSRTHSPTAPSAAAPVPGERPGCLSAILRIYWMMLGFVPLVFLAVDIARNEGFSPGRKDLLFVGAWIALVAARLVDIAFLNGQTTKGLPATPRHGARFALLTTLAALVLWGAASLVAGLQGA